MQNIRKKEEKIEAPLRFRSISLSGKGSILFFFPCNLRFNSLCAVVVSPDQSNCSGN